MFGYSPVPVDYQPDFGDVSLVPVDYDPFADEGGIQPAQTQRESQPGSGMQVADAANENLTPYEICDHAQAMCSAAVRVTAPAGEAQNMRLDCKNEYDLCLAKANRGVFSKNGDVIFFPDGGKVIFRPQYQLYVPSPNQPQNFLKPD